MWLSWILVACGNSAPKGWWIEGESACPERTVLEQSKPVVGREQVWCARRNGRKHGPFVEFHDGGQPYREGAYDNGKRDAAWTIYDADGKPTGYEVWDRGVLKSEKPAN